MWLARHKNVHFHHTPTHASWLSQIEIWFSILTSQSLNGASFTSVKDLVAHIDAFIEQYNQTPKTLRLDQIQGPPKAPQSLFRGPMIPGTRRGDDQAALRERAQQRLSPPPPIGPTWTARLVENLDYLGFFRAAPRVVSLRALNELGGIAMETGNSWRDHDDLTHEAAIIARAKRWLPEFLRGAPPPSSSSRSPIEVSTK